MANVMPAVSISVSHLYRVGAEERRTGGNGREPRRSIERLATVEPHAVAVATDEHPIAVVLDFVHPSAPDGGASRSTGWAGTTPGRISSE
jgi:hypothetical protein